MFWKRENLLPLAGYEPRTVQPIVTILTTVPHTHSFTQYISEASCHKMTRYTSTQCSDNICVCVCVCVYIYIYTHTHTHTHTHICSDTVHTMGWDSSVGIAIRYGLKCPGIESQWGRHIPRPSRLALGHTQPPVQWVPGLSRG
jgi:hypothetical protein